MLKKIVIGGMCCCVLPLTPQSIWEKLAREQKERGQAAMNILKTLFFLVAFLDVGHMLAQAMQEKVVGTDYKDFFDTLNDYSKNLNDHIKLLKSDRKYMDDLYSKRDLYGKRMEQRAIDAKIKTDAEDWMLEGIKLYAEKEGFDVAEKGPKEKFPLERAAATGSLKIVQYLFNKGKDIKIQTNNKDINYIDGQGDKLSDTALGTAIRGGYVDIVNFLIDNGAKFIDPYLWNLRWWDGTNLKDKLAILKKTMPLTTYKPSNSVLPWAAQYGDRDVWNFILQQGFDLTEKFGGEYGEGGKTPLEIAIDNKNQVAQESISNYLEQQKRLIDHLGSALKSFPKKA